MVLIGFALFGFTLGALFGVPLAFVLRCVRSPWRRSLYLVAVASSIVPYALHYHYSLQYLARSGVAHYSGLAQYTSAVPTTMVVAAVTALLIARRWPRVAASFPIVLGGVYWSFLVPLLYRETPPSFVGLDNVPFVWLFVSSVAACVFLLLLDVLALEHRDRHVTSEFTAVGAADPKAGSG